MNNPIQVTEIDVSLVTEDVRSELERVLSMSCAVLLQRYFVSDQYMTMTVKEESKPFFRTMLTMMTGVEVVPGKGYQIRFRLMVDEAGEPVFQVALVPLPYSIHEEVVSYVRLINVDDLFQVHYARSYEGLKEVLAEDTNIAMIISSDFHTSSNASCHENSIHFEVTLD